uniref:Uncharacterized protein n=1 Tax=Arundo donax TaxID=35708 RepID=A0A0A9HNC7_ARUDO
MYHVPFDKFAYLLISFSVKMTVESA